MGFHRRTITKTIIEITDESRIGNLLNADAFVMDTWSHDFFELFKQGKSKQECIDILNGVDKVDLDNDLPYPEYSKLVVKSEMKERYNKI